MVDSYLYLGVTISSDLRWHKHVNSVSPKATRTLTFVQRNIYRCLPDVKTLAYTLLIRPHLEFASAACRFIVSFRSALLKPPGPVVVENNF